MNRLPSLADIVGPVSPESAAVLVFAFITLCIVITTAIAKRKSRLAMHQEFELAKIKASDEQALAERRLAHEQEAKLYGLETTRTVELEKTRQTLAVGYSETPRSQ